LADVELRRTSRNAVSLDTVVAGLQACCAESVRTWTAVDVLARMDALAGRPVFSELAQRHLDEASFPDVDATFAALGVTPAGDDAVIDPTSPLAFVRDAIMAPLSTHSSPAPDTTAAPAPRDPAAVD
jgi:hypothetical protein